MRPLVAKDPKLNMRVAVSGISISNSLICSHTHNQCPGPIMSSNQKHRQIIKSILFPHGG